MVTAINQAYQLMHTHFHDRVRRNEPLTRHCSFEVGGPADLWVALDTHEELETLLRLCATHHVPLLLTGAGRNVIFADEGVRGIVARMDLQRYEIQDHRDGTATLIAEAGVRWPQLLHQLIPAGWSGLEFGIGIPGTLGAGLVSNAGAHNQELGQALEWIEVLDARNCNTHVGELFPTLVMRRYHHDDIDLSYRHSRFRINRYTHLDRQGNLIFPVRQLIEPAEIIVKLGLRLHHEDPRQLTARCDGYIEDRRANEPPLPGTGPIFKDPPGSLAKDVIAQAGLGGKTIGKAQISEQNPNYIVNADGATAREIFSLIKEAHQGVLKHAGIELALNVDILGAWPGRS
ncbi:UDP-N-acetylmuramate dehydrogenase [Ktedonospora formicarum]|uniref:UDP-N-acetylenolpyruvoylglucosamine reductase n=1 Tax=Ktedonospora formicarum TaxID=2778364 RepID=A0A8J3I9Y2_9CHLR|nr:UDP-N-acetylmuramate dehydrogenase [Ktedonospora formicarum]GHO48712.1 UDP-N-acetylenolpyruvoylglucosamine reductase [Ktedonospora formicarum]